MREIEPVTMNGLVRIVWCEGHEEKVVQDFSPSGSSEERAEVLDYNVIPTGQWSEPCTCGRISASFTFLTKPLETPK